MADFDIVAHVSRIEANRSLKDALMQGLKTRRPPYRISVTDLVSPKQAYFKRKYPEITPSMEKQQLLWTGAGFHKTFGSAVSTEEYLEQFVECDGIVGKIDIYERIPVEVKTTSVPLDNRDLLQYRPAYIEQLGMYCAMVNVPKGQIIVYQHQESSLSSPLVVYHVDFPDLEGIRKEMRRRRDLLMHALVSNDPSNLSPCAWCNSQCDYFQVCDGKTSSLPPPYEVAQLAKEIYLDNHTCEQLLAKLSTPRPTLPLRINDIVFPRKTYFARLQSPGTCATEDTPEGEDECLRSISERGFLEVLYDTLRFGISAEVRRVPVQHVSLTDMVQTWQGIPTILRNPKFSSLVDRERLPTVFPHYFLRLGFECALTNQVQGRLLVYYTNVPREDAKLMVYDVSFRSLNTIVTEASRRLDLLQKETSVFALPKCPSWMCSGCRYKLECGEG